MPAAPSAGTLYPHAEDVAEEGEDGDEMLLDPPDPSDLLLAHSKEGLPGGPRPLDFVREKLRGLKSENARLHERVQDLEQTLSIVQTAQEWSVGKGMTKEQIDKMNEIKLLLEQAKKAKEEIATFSTSSRQNLYEKLRSCKLTLRKEREEKKEMRTRLVTAFDSVRRMKAMVEKVEQQRAIDQANWQEDIRGLKEKHLKEMRRLNSGGAMASSAHGDQLTQFNEQMIGELTAMQQHIQVVKEDTIDAVVFEGDSVFESHQSSDPHSQEHWSQEQPYGLVGGTDSDDMAGVVP